MVENEIVAHSSLTSLRTNSAANGHFCSSHWANRSHLVIKQRAVMLVGFDGMDIPWLFVDSLAVIHLDSYIRSLTRKVV